MDKTTMSQVAWVAVAMSRLPSLEGQDAEAVKLGLESMYRNGYQVRDAIDLSLLLEECGCQLDEGEALVKMAAIKAKYDKAS